MRDGITDPFPNFWEWISHFIPHFTGHVITYPCWDLSLSTLLKGTHGKMYKGPNAYFSVNRTRANEQNSQKLAKGICSHTCLTNQSPGNAGDCERHQKLVWSGELNNEFIHQIWALKSSSTYIHPSPKVMADFFQTQESTWCPYSICTIFGGCIKWMQVFIFCAKYIDFLL